MASEQCSVAGDEPCPYVIAQHQRKETEAESKRAVRRYWVNRVKNLEARLKMAEEIIRDYATLAGEIHILAKHSGYWRECGEGLCMLRQGRLARLDAFKDQSE